MASVDPVPETTAMRCDELTAEDAWRTLRRSPGGVLRQGLTRFRNGDGLSHARALAFQLCLALIPLVVALVGLASSLHAVRLGRVLRLTMLQLTPGESDALARDTLDPLDGGGRAATLALWAGLLFALVALTMAMGQVERGANRIYGIDSDRPSARKYLRAFAMAATAGITAMGGFVVIISGSAFGASVEAVYGVDDDVVTSVALPIGVVFLLVSVTGMLRFAPRRRQPGWSWLAFGAVVALILWLGFTALLVVYVQLSGSFGVVYGPLAGVVALLLWAELTSVAVFLALALTAQLEATRIAAHSAQPSASVPR